MRYNTESSFPQGMIDNKEFISDVDITHKPIMETHQNYINDGSYESASHYLKTQTEITPITADLLNLIQNRQLALQTYLQSIDICNRTVYGNEPAKPTNEMIWIES